MAAAIVLVFYKDIFHILLRYFENIYYAKLQQKKCKSVSHVTSICERHFS